MKEKNNFLHKILLMVFVPSVLFLVLETSLRFSPYSERLGPHRFDGGLADHALFWDPDDVIDSPYKLHTEFRGKRFTVEKPQDVYRIVCLGGSFTYGWPYNNKPSVAYPAVLEGVLNSLADYDKRFEVINAGVGGYTSYQALFYFKHRLYKLDPDLVTICFGANDGNINHEIGVFCSDEEYYERLMTISKNKILFKIRSFLNNLRLYALIEKAIFNIRKIYAKPRQRVPPKDFETNLREFLELAKNYRFKILFIIEPHRNLENFKLEIYRNPYYGIMHKLTAENPNWIGLVDTISLVRKHRYDDIFYDVMHLKPFGHKILAQSIADLLQKSDFLN